jgi:tRNA pseudouridine55 synthase
MSLLRSSYYTGILPVNKPRGKTSFNLVSILRKLTNIRTIGHAGTLDPFAEGVMILLIGKDFTRLSNSFLNQNKEYLGEVHLGIETDSFDTDGIIVAENPYVPTIEEIESALLHFQGTFLQVPPMFSAKKVDGKKLYELARKGITIEREPVSVTAHIELISYTYPKLILKVASSKGTYIRSIAQELGQRLTCGAHLSALTRTRSGKITLDQCCDGALLTDCGYNWMQYLNPSGLKTPSLES